MRTMFKILLASAAIGLTAVPASAQTIVNCATTTGMCISTDENVLINNGTNQLTVLGSTQNTGVSVRFSSTGNTLNSANGQAVVSAFDGVLENLTFTLLNGATFQTAFFNITPLTGNDPNEAISAIFTFNNGTTSTQALDRSGNNQFGVTAGSAGISSVMFVAQGGATLGVDSLRQLRLGGVSSITTAVPEPATWAMMLFGFGAIGSSLRRRKRRALLQVA